MSATTVGRERESLDATSTPERGDGSDVLDAPSIGRALASVLPAGLVVEEAPIDDVPPAEEPTHEEVASLGACVPARRREFAVGRACARRALRRLGHASMSIPIGADRGPVWPAGVIGSISHSTVACLAVVARSADFASVGVDLEVDRGLEESLWPFVLHAGERAHIVDEARRRAVAAGHLATLCFSAKESFYKAQAPLTNAMLDFLDVHVELRRDSFVLRLARDAGQLRAHSTWSGCFVRAAGSIATAMWITPATLQRGGSA